MGANAEANRSGSQGKNKNLKTGIKETLLFNMVGGIECVSSVDADMRGS